MRVMCDHQGPGFRFGTNGWKAHGSVDDAGGLQVKCVAGTHRLFPIESPATGRVGLRSVPQMSDAGHGHTDCDSMSAPRVCTRCRLLFGMRVLDEWAPRRSLAFERGDATNRCGRDAEPSLGWLLTVGVSPQARMRTCTWVLRSCCPTVGPLRDGQPRPAPRGGCSEMHTRSGRRVG